MKNSVMAITGVTLAGVAFASQAGATSEAAPVLYDAAPAVVEAKIDETPMAASIRTPSLPVQPMDVQGAMPAATVDRYGSNAVAGIELDPNGVARFGNGNGDIDVKAGTFENVEQGRIVMMAPDGDEPAPEFNDEITVGQMYFGQDGQVYQFVGPAD